jgi:hypothetical protein
MPSSEKPIDEVKRISEDISKLVKNMRVDINVMRADIKMIKEKIDEKEKVEKVSGGWWIY